MGCQALGCDVDREKYDHGLYKKPLKTQISPTKMIDMEIQDPDFEVWEDRAEVRTSQKRGRRSITPGGYPRKSSKYAGGQQPQGSFKQIQTPGRDYSNTLFDELFDRIAKKTQCDPVAMKQENLLQELQGITPQELAPLNESNILKNRGISNKLLEKEDRIMRDNCEGKLKVRHLTYNDYAQGFSELKEIDSSPLGIIPNDKDVYGFFNTIKNRTEFEMEYKFLFPSQQKHLKAVVIEQNGKIVAFGVLFILRNPVKMSEKMAMKNETPITVRQGKLCQILLHPDYFKDDTKHDVLIPLINTLEKMAWANKCLDIDSEERLIEAQTFGEYGYQSYTKKGVTHWFKTNDNQLKV